MKNQAMYWLIALVIILGIAGFFYMDSSPYFSPRATTEINVNRCIELASQCITLAGECEVARDKCNTLELTGASARERADCWNSGDGTGADEICEAQRKACEQFRKQCAEPLKISSKRIL